MARIEDYLIGNNRLIETIDSNILYLAYGLSVNHIPQSVKTSMLVEFYGDIYDR